MSVLKIEKHADGSATRSPALRRFVNDNDNSKAMMILVEEPGELKLNVWIHHGSTSNWVDFETSFTTIVAC